MQSFLQFEQALKQRSNHPKIVIMMYANFHNARNMFLRKRQREVIAWHDAGPLIQPFAMLDSNHEIRIKMSATDYWAPPLIGHSALVNFLDEQYAKYEEKHVNSQEVTEALLLKFQALVSKSGAKMVLANIFYGDDMKQFAQTNQIPYVDIFVSLKDAKYQNPLGIGHPSPLANKVFAEKLGTFLEGIL